MNCLSNTRLMPSLLNPLVIPLGRKGSKRLKEELDPQISSKRFRWIRNHPRCNPAETTKMDSSKSRIQSKTRWPWRRKLWPSWISWRSLLTSIMYLLSSTRLQKWTQFRTTLKTPNLRTPSMITSRQSLATALNRVPLALALKWWVHRVQSAIRHINHRPIIPETWPVGEVILATSHPGPPIWKWQLMELKTLSFHPLILQQSSWMERRRKEPKMTKWWNSMSIEWLINPLSH